jgi:hypothetical protein
VRENAENKALGNVIWLKELKKDKPDLLICVGGCMTQEKGMAEVMKKNYPFIDLIYGTVEGTDGVGVSQAADTVVRIGDRGAEDIQIGIAYEGFPSGITLVCSHQLYNTAENAKLSLCYGRNTCIQKSDGDGGRWGCFFCGKEPLFQKHDTYLLF